MNDDRIKVEMWKSYIDFCKKIFDRILLHKGVECV